MAQHKLSADEAMLWYSWKLASDTVLSHVGRAITEGTGLSGPDYAVLSRLHLLGRGWMAQQDLADSMRWDKSRLSHHLTRMEKRSLVRRRSEGRGVAVVLTARGLKQFEAAVPVHAEAVRRHMMSRLTPEQRQVFTELSRLLHDIPPEEEWERPEA